MRVLLADAHDQVRRALRTVIGEQPGMMLIGEVSAADNLLSSVETLRPDLLLLEWELPGRHAERLMATLQATNTRPMVIVLGNQSHLRDLALSAGADAFVSKSDPPERLLTALDNVIRRWHQKNRISQELPSSFVQ